MLNYDFTTKLLDIKEAIVKNYEITQDIVEVEYIYPVKPHACPYCGYVTSLVHDYRGQKVRDIPIQGKATILLYRKRRYKCAVCNKRFIEKQPLVPKFHQLTNRLVYHIMNQLKQKRSMTDIAKENYVSLTTVNRVLDMVSLGKPRGLPQVLSIDEFKGDTNSIKFQCILTDPVHKRIVDILPSRSNVTIIDYLKGFSNRANVKFFIMDMNKSYLGIAKSFLPNATIIIDKFHVVRYNTWAFENVRRRVQQHLPPERRKYFKRSRKLLLARMNSLSDDNKQAVNVMLGFSNDLTNAYLLKEEFYKFMDSNNSESAKIQLKRFMLLAQLHNLKEYGRCITMLNNWKQYILNSFDYSYSNGYTEGINNKIKVHKRIAFGFKTFNNLRNRVLLEAYKTS